MEGQFSFFENKEGVWHIDIDNDERMLRCSQCESRYILEPFLFSSGTKGFAYCGYCGARMKNPDQKYLRWPGIFDNKGEEVNWRGLC